MISKVGFKNTLDFKHSEQAEFEPYSKVGISNVIKNQRSNLTYLKSHSLPNNFTFIIKPQIKTAKPVTFTADGGFSDQLVELTRPVFVCKDQKTGKGDDIGNRVFINPVFNKYAKKLNKPEDAIKTTIEIHNEAGLITEARTQVKNMRSDFLYEMAVRVPRHENSISERSDLQYKIGVQMKPSSNYKEKVYTLNTKGKVIAVVEDGENVLMTNSGVIIKNNNDGNTLPLKVFVEQIKRPQTFDPFTPLAQIVNPIQPKKSIGEGGEMIIGMEEGRFCPEIVNSIRDFEKKINDGEIVLPQFVAKDGAKNIQIAVLAAGLGSRAEYANASSDKIFHGKDDGAESTKSVFRLPTGLTPMETSFITMHLAGIIDCSEGKFGIGKNVKFYLNKSGVNKGNGGFTIDLHNKTFKENQTCEFIFPNDPISRMPEATAQIAELMNEGNTAIAMIAKKIPTAQAKATLGDFGFMKISENNEILAFSEKPKVLPTGFADENGNYFTNTFQFALSKEAFESLEIIEPHFSSALTGKEVRDWSNHLVPTIIALSQAGSVEEMKAILPKIVGKQNSSGFENFLEDVTPEVFAQAKEKLRGQKVVAVPTDEPWADVGQLSALYETIINIAKGDFKLLDFERRNVLRSINPHTGLIAMSPEQKALIEQKYDIHGKVIVVPKAKKVNPKIMDDYKDFIIVNNKKK